MGTNVSKIPIDSEILSKTELINALQKMKTILSQKEYSAIYRALVLHNIVDKDEYIVSENSPEYIFPSWNTVLSLWKDSDSRLHSF